MANKDLSENIEEYLEVLYKYGNKDSQVSTTTLSNHLGIAPGSVTQMLKKLEDLDYINYIPYKGAYLSDKGFKVAQKITRKHRILEKFLTEILHIKKENVHIQACDMEHSLSDEAERAMCHILNYPNLCPDEKPIPPCDLDFKTCQDCIDNENDIEEIGIRDENLVLISQLHRNEKGEVLFIRGDSNVLKQLMSLGIAIGTLIYVEEFDEIEDHLSIYINNSKVKIPRYIANNVFVKIC
ncbi:MAG: metal-dependent transcriptional regulator [Methanobrevibacter sp.]|nr:metal-dependent transcriptional regulator [Methanobrevibacter sp.]